MSPLERRQRRGPALGRTAWNESLGMTEELRR